MSTDFERKGAKVNRVIRKLKQTHRSDASITPVKFLAPAGPQSWGPNVVRNKL